MNKQVIKVACAIIEHDGRILAAQRSADMSLPLMWEFPGGKLEPEETIHECLVREVKEELNLDVEAVKALEPHSHPYGEKIIMLVPFTCRITGGELKMQEHADLQWGHPEDLLTIDWAPADLPVLKQYLLQLENQPV